MESLIHLTCLSDQLPSIFLISGFVSIQCIASGLEKVRSNQMKVGLPSIEAMEGVPQHNQLDKPGANLLCLRTMTGAMSTF